MKEKEASKISERLMTYQDLCDLLGMSEPWVRRRVSKGIIPSIKLGQSVRFIPDEIDAWLGKQRSTKNGKRV